MLETIDTSRERIDDRGRPVSVGGDRQAEVVSLVDDGPQLLDGELALRLVGALGHEPTARHDLRAPHRKRRVPPVTEVAQDRSTAGLSIYWVCEEGRGPLIDLLAEEVFAPAWNAQVEAGLINSWSWFAHFLGGEYRRLLVADGADNNAVLTARDNVIECMSEESPGLAGEFSRVCNGHTDYLWSIESS